MLDVNKQFLKNISVFLGIIVIGILLWRPLYDIFSNVDKFKEAVLSFGIFAPLIFIGLVILQVLFSPFPGQVAGLAAGFIFGTFSGTIYSMIGLIIGSFFAFSLARIYGRPLVEKVVSESMIKKFDKLTVRGGELTLFLIYLLPALPDDAICYIAGLTKIRIRNLVILSTIGRFPGFLVLAIVGDNVSSGNLLFSLILFSTFLIIAIIMYIFRENLEKLMLRFIEVVKGKKNK